MEKEVRIASIVLLALACTGLITGIVTNTAYPIVAGSVASASACLWQITASKWGK